jgi:hypothetical protein
VNSGFGRRQGEDEPAAARIHGTQAEKVAKEGAVGFRVVAVEEDVRAGDSGKHGASLAHV